MTRRFQQYEHRGHPIDIRRDGALGQFVTIGTSGPGAPLKGSGPRPLKGPGPRPLKEPRGFLERVQAQALNRAWAQALKRGQGSL